MSCLWLPVTVLAHFDDSEGSLSLMEMRAVPSSGTTTSHGCLEGFHCQERIRSAHCWRMHLRCSCAWSANFAGKLACVSHSRELVDVQRLRQRLTVWHRSCALALTEFVAHRITQLGLVCFLRDRVGSSLQGFLREMRESLAVNKILMPLRASERVRSLRRLSTLEGRRPDNHLEC